MKSLDWKRMALWLVLAMPVISYLEDFEASPLQLRRLIEPSGDWAARWLIVTLALTPLMLLARRQAWVRWLVARRRDFGLAAFSYTALHLALYLLHRDDLGWVLDELRYPQFWTGWLALIVLLPIALTSNDWSVRRLGPRWKTVQRLTYVAAALTLVHWILLKPDWSKLLLHVAPLAALQLYRLWWMLGRRRSHRVIATQP